MRGDAQEFDKPSRSWIFVSNGTCESKGHQVGAASGLNRHLVLYCETFFTEPRTRTPATNTLLLLDIYLFINEWLLALNV